MFIVLMIYEYLAYKQIQLFQNNKIVLNKQIQEQFKMDHLLQKKKSWLLVSFYLDDYLIKIQINQLTRQKMKNPTLQQYFLMHKHPKPQLTKSLQSLNLQTLISIQKGDININENHNHQQCLKKPQNPEQTNKQKIKEQIHSLQKNKNHMLHELSDIYQKQKELRSMNLREKHRIEKSGSPKMQRSVMTSEERKKIILAKRAQKKFEESLTKKLDQLNRKIKTEEQQILASKQIEREVQKNKRKLLIKQKRYRTQQQQQSRQQQLNSSKKTINKSQYLYKQIQKNDRQLEKERQRYNTLILNEKKNKQFTDFSLMKQHSIDHDVYINEKKEEFQKILHENMMNNKKSAYFAQSIFIRKLKDENRAKKIEQERSKRRIKDMRDKVLEFREYVLENYKPKSSEKSHFSPKKKIQVLSSLNHEERYAMGKNYLSEARKVIKKKEQLKTHRQTQQTTAELFSKKSKSPSTKKYDYLNDLKQQRKSTKKADTLKDYLKQNSLEPEKAQKAAELIKQKEQTLGYFKKNEKSKSDYMMAKQKITLLNSMLNNEYES